MVLRNATVLTMDPVLPTADAVAIAGDTITAVGTEIEVLAAAAPNATIVDIGGRVLLPGFNDAHCHRISDRESSGYESAEAAIQDALAGGWTSISELFVSEERLDELRALDDANRLRLRVNCYLPVNSLDDKFGVGPRRRSQPIEIASRRTKDPDARAGEQGSGSLDRGPRRMLRRAIERRSGPAAPAWATAVASAGPGFVEPEARHEVPLLDLGEGGHPVIGATGCMRIREHRVIGAAFR